jgi:hypothetical protein
MDPMPTHFSKDSADSTAAESEVNKFYARFYDPLLLVVHLRQRSIDGAAVGLESRLEGLLQDVTKGAGFDALELAVEGCPLQRL